jgi:hypothetical protein
MSKSLKPSLPRLKQILQRQDPPAFGLEYTPSILATREEAPPGSRYCPSFDRRLGRDVHFLSLPELRVGAILLYCPWLFDMQEQRLIHFDTRPHPLDGHPRLGAARMSALRGACEVAESLGVLRHYPLVSGSHDGVPFTVPFVFLGDLLGFFAGSCGPYCVNLNVKAHRSDFSEPFDEDRAVADPELAREETIARHMIERVRYEGAGIKSVEVAALEEVPDGLFHTLRHLLLLQKRRCTLSESIRHDVVGALKLGVLAGQSAREVILRLHDKDASLEIEQLQIVFFQAVWNRELRLDLFSPVLIDKPMRAERRDVLDVYAHWLTAQ